MLKSCHGGSYARDDYGANKEAYVWVAAEEGSPFGGRNQGGSWSLLITGVRAERDLVPVDGGPYTITSSPLSGWAARRCFVAPSMGACSPGTVPGVTCADGSYAQAPSAWNAALKRPCHMCPRWCSFTSTVSALGQDQLLESCRAEFVPQSFNSGKRPTHTHHTAEVATLHCLRATHGSTHSAPTRKRVLPLGVGKRGWFDWRHRMHTVQLLLHSLSVLECDPKVRR